jgi:hypothetical protein
MNILTKYDITQPVLIKAIEMPGSVSKIIVDGKNLFYEVAYWAECQLKFVTLDEEEIELRGRK